MAEAPSPDLWVCLLAWLQTSPAVGHWAVRPQMTHSLRIRTREMIWPSGDLPSRAGSVVGENISLALSLRYQ